MFYQVTADSAKVVRPTLARRNAFDADYLQIRMFHSGHGECILIVFPNQPAWLVDCGFGTGAPKNETLADEVVAYLAKEDLFLDTIIPTHPHSDHAKALTTILETDCPRRLANPLTVFRSDDPGWKRKERKWLPFFHDAVYFWGNESVFKGQRHREHIGNRIEAHLFAGKTGKKFYISLFIQLRFRGARILFTGDAYKPYERTLLNEIGAQYFRSDVLKVTHHGSAGGTDAGVLAKIRPGIAIASTGGGSLHNLENVTRDRIAARGTRVFETYRNRSGHVDEHDIVVETDGQPYQGVGILYRVRELKPKFSY